MAEEKGWDWDQRFSEWQQDLEVKLTAGRKETSFKDAFQLMVKLQQFQPDNHTGPLNDDKTFKARSKTAVLTRTPKGPATKIFFNNGQEISVNPNEKSAQPQ